LDSTQQGVSNAQVAKSLPEGDQSWTKVSLLNSPGPTTYPIATFTYLLLPKDLSTNPSLDQTKAKALVDFISWAITDGQKLASNWLCSTARTSREAQSRYPKIINFQGNSSIHRTITKRGTARKLLEKFFFFFFDVFEILAVKLMDNQWVRSTIVKDSD
jgi:hypothetical protein